MSPLRLRVCQDGGYPVAEGRLGQLGQRFLCAPTDYSIRRTSEVEAPAILDLCIEDEIDVALFVPL